MNLPSLIFFATALTFWFGLHALLARRLIRQGTRYPVWANRMIAGGVVMLAVFPLLGFFGRRIGMGGPGVLSWIGYTLMGVSTLLIVFALAAELVRLGASGWLAIRRKLRRQPAAELEAPALPQRRAFFADLVNYGIVGGATGLTGMGFSEARRVPRVVEVDVPVAGLHPDLDGLRIVQLSDVHIGPTIRGTWLDQVVEVVNGLDADVVALTGDFVDGFVDDLVPEMGALGRIQARHGSFFVTGNHEYYWDGPAWCRAIDELGPRTLTNSHVVIEHGGARMLVAGVADLHADRYVPEHACNPAKAREGAPEVDFSLLLAHQPKTVFAAAPAGYDLQLSGHTHAGQYFPMSLLIHLMQTYVSGLNQHENMQIYVSSGTGYWGPPNRAGSPSEITALTLRAV